MTTYPAPPEEGEEQYNPHTGEHDGAMSKRLSVRLRMYTQQAC